MARRVKRAAVALAFNPYGPAVSSGWLAAIAAAVLLITGVMHARLLKPPQDRWPALAWPSIGALQRAGTGRQMVALMERFGSEGRSRLRLALWVDLLIVGSYMTLLLCGAGWSEQVLRAAPLSESYLAVGLWVTHGAAVATCLAGLLDLVENSALGVALRRWPVQVGQLTGPELQDERRKAAQSQQHPAQVAAFATSAKWLLLALVILWMAVTTVLALA